MFFPAGKKIGIVGHSGCGKSSIANILLRFYNHQGGDVFIDGKEISQYDTAALRRQIGYVMQEPMIFNTTIKDNIHFGNPNATDSKIHQISELAYCL